MTFQGILLTSFLRLFDILPLRVSLQSMVQTFLEIG